MKSFRIYLLPIFSAVLLGLSRIDLPLDMFVFVAFVPMFYYFDQMADGTHQQNHWLSGAIFSVVYLSISIHWITLVTVGGFLGMLFLFAGAFGLLFWLVSRCYKYKVLLYQFSFIAGWLCFEHGCNFSEFRYPWYSVGYGLNNSLSLLQVLEIGGPIFLGFLILAVNFLIYLAMTHRKKYWLLPLGLLILWWGYGNARRDYVVKRTQAEDFSVALIQGNIDQEHKWQDDMIDSTFTIYGNLATDAVSAGGVKLVIYPEAALPVYLMYDQAYYIDLCIFTTKLGVPIFTGYPHVERVIKYKGQDSPFLYYNASNLFYPDHTNNPLRKEPYYKNILVPFGERTPFLDKVPLLWKLQMGQANFESGNGTVIYSVGERTFAPLICFEVVFPYFLRDIAFQHNPDFWVNITNDAWFYRSIGTLQHANMAIFRSIETRKPIFRVANTGYSFYTTPDGQIHEQTSLFERTFVRGVLHTFLRSSAVQTPFVSYGYMIIYLFLTLFTLQIFYILYLWLRFRVGVRHG